MLTEEEQRMNNETANKQYTEKRQLFTEALHAAMRVETESREAYNAALRALRRAERATKTAAETLGDHTQRMLSL